MILFFLVKHRLLLLLNRNQAYNENVVRKTDTNRTTRARYQTQCLLIARRTLIHLDAKTVIVVEILKLQ